VDAGTGDQLLFGIRKQNEAEAKENNDYCGRDNAERQKKRDRAEMVADCRGVLLRIVALRRASRSALHR
jgi:hypothetical protein